MNLAAQDGDFGILIEEVQPVGVEGNADLVANAGGAARVDAGDDVVVLAGANW